MNKEKKSQQKQFLRSRRGIILIALIAVMVLLINLITASYSWFTPQSDAQRGMKYEFSGKVRSENCSVTTFTGIKVTASNKGEGEYINQIRYDSEHSIAYGSSIPCAANTTNYYKTEIINGDGVNASDISLYANGLPACTLAVTYPGNSVRKFSSSPGEIYIVRDAYVPPHDKSDESGNSNKLVIEWFVTTGNTSGNINLTLLYN